MSNMPNTRKQMGRNRETDVDPWDMQPWDTGVSFERFRNFYLTQELPRSVVGAYRRYKRWRGMGEAEVERIRAAPGTWKHWAYGRDAKGRQVPNALTWAERARAYDVDVADRRLREQEELWEKRRNELRESDWQTGQALRARAERMQLGLLFGKETVVSTDADGKNVTKIVYEPTNWSERDMIAAVKLASDLQRRGAGEPPNNPVPRGGWREQAQQAGFDPDDVRRWLKDALAEESDAQEDNDEI